MTDGKHPFVHRSLPGKKRTRRKERERERNSLGTCVALCRRMQQHMSLLVGLPICVTDFPRVASTFAVWLLQKYVTLYFKRLDEQDEHINLGSVY